MPLLLFLAVVFLENVVIEFQLSNIGMNVYQGILPVSTFHNDDFCVACLPMLCSGCLELTTENCH